jgi:hypothetical protein
VAIFLEKGVLNGAETLMECRLLKKLIEKSPFKIDLLIRDVIFKIALKILARRPHVRTGLNKLMG